MSLGRVLLASCLLAGLADALAAVGAPAAKPAKPKEGPLRMKFVPLRKGTFYVGGGGSKVGEKTAINEDYEIAVHPVTQGQWQEVMGDNPSWFSREGGGKEKVKDLTDEELKLFPVESVSWEDVQTFIKYLNEKEQGGGWLYRLPTEAEWEYACRGGATSEHECSFHFYLGKPTNDLSSKQANFDGRYPEGKGEEGPYLGRPTKVGSYAPNELGLYDMHGNVWQWCQDLHEKGGNASRGGCWFYDGSFCRARSCVPSSPSERSSLRGFRLARVPSSSIIPEVGHQPYLAAKLDLWRRHVTEFSIKPGQ
jgi:formylglycine-generating enzyme required for sulfatase activity